ncbi:hypothetical protein DSO57_1015706 [Entomophthora muscae]|uniref:Uncharacterized protein n=1 Tax=Entomophthora muscae TaxID=34485 RepID=A0ACC2S7I4_9FUNG|nr:hypothetical protein DSO57_1015706 [Entomophthora muscae]
MSTKNVADRGNKPLPLALSSSSMEIHTRANKPYYENSRHSWVFTKAPPAPEALTAIPTAFYSPSFEGLPEEKPSSFIDAKRCSASNLKELKLKDDLNRKRAPIAKSTPLLDSAVITTNITGNSSQRNSVSSSNRDSVSSDMGYFSTSPGSEPGKATPAILNQLSRSNINPQEVLSRQMESSLKQNLVSPSPRPYSEDATPLTESAIATARSSSYLTPISFSPTASFNELPHRPLFPRFKYEISRRPV